MTDLRSLQAILYSIAGMYACILMLLSVCIIRVDPDLPPPPECKNLLDCNEGELCTAGKCEQLVERVAQEGESCFDATCAKGLRCNEELICAKPEEGPRPPLTCESVRAKRAIKEVIKRCDSQNSEKSYADGCSIKDFNDRVMDDETFDLLISSWNKDMFTIIFPRDLSKRAWKDAQQTLIQQLESRKQKLNDAAEIFVITRLGIDGDTASDQERGKALTRAQRTREVIKSLVPSNADIGYNVRFMALNPKRRLQLRHFRDYLAKSAYGIDDAATREIRSDAETSIADINRSVHVILYPCKEGVE